MRAYLYIICMVAAALLSSCRHKELCLMHPHTADVTIVADWSEFDKQTPTGMTVMVYPQEEGGKAVRHQTHDISHADMGLPVGIYNSIVFNQSQPEFGSVLFRGMDSYETAEVYCNSSKSSWYQTKTDEERLGEEPEWLGTSRHEGAAVTKEMLYATTEATLSAQSRSSLEFIIAEHTPENIIYTIRVTVHIRGIYNLRSARASLTGLAEGYFLGKGRYSASKITQLIEQWSTTVDKNDPTKGTINAVFTCFGLPDGHTGIPEDNLLSLSLLLVDNKTIKDYTFEVGDKFIHYDGEEAEVNISLSLELDLELGETLPDVKPVDGTNSAFDATVNDWGEEENYEIEIN